MAITSTYARLIIKQNGHLQLEGTETRAQLLEALRNLRTHTYDKCMRTGFGTPIEALIPDSRMLDTVRIKRKPVQTVNVDLSNESL